MYKKGDIEYILNEPVKKAEYKLFSKVEADKAKRFHEGIPGYDKTPLTKLSALAQKWGLKNIYVKDESYRFGLNSFKALGGSYSIANLLCNELKIDIGSIDFNYLVSPKVKNKLGEMTFTTSSDGNHGRSIAWTAEKLGHKAVIYMPKGTAEARVKNIESHGGIVHVTEVNYDEAVKIACDEAEKNGWFVTQDTAWEGYTDIPTWLMQGYMTMGAEAVEQLGDTKPTHVFLQAGVGAYAGAIQAFLAEVYKGASPVSAVVEPKAAACMYKSALIGDGKPYSVTGELNSIMAGLACGEPNPIGWDILKQSASCFIKCEDYLTANGMRILSNPIKDDKRVISGESGAVGIGVLDMIMNNEDYLDLRKSLGLGKDSTVLFFSTEGATDPVNYTDIVWYGKYSKF